MSNTSLALDVNQSIVDGALLLGIAGLALTDRFVVPAFGAAVLKVGRLAKAPRVASGVFTWERRAISNARLHACLVDGVAGTAISTGLVVDSLSQDTRSERQGSEEELIVHV